MHSGQGDEGPDNVYRPTPLPREPQAPSGSEPREGIVLPSKGGRWVPPSQRREPGRDQWDQSAPPPAAPASGQPWGPQQPEPYGVQQPVPYGEVTAPHPADAQSTQLLAPYDPGAAQQATAAYSGDTAAGYPGAGFDPSHGGQQPLPSGEAERTQLLAPYGQQQPDGRQAPGGAPLPSGEAERTQLLAPYGQQQPGQPQPATQPYGQQQSATQQYSQQPIGGDADRTQLIAPYAGHTAELVPQAPGARPLPPEQRFDAAMPPMPQEARPGAPQDAQQYMPPMPGTAPYAIRPGAPGDQQPAYDQNGGAPATQQLPRLDDAWQQGGPQPTQQPDDYDYLYRRADQPAPRVAAAARPVGAFPQTAPPGPQYPGGYGGDSDRTGGYDGRGGQGSRGTGKKLSTPVLVGIGVIALAVIGIGAGVLFTPDSNPVQPPSPSASGSAAPTGSTEPDAVQGQAKQLDALLKTSNSSRTSVINAVASIKTCDNLSASAATLHAAARERDDLVTELSGMTLTALPNSADLVGQLKTAWKASSAADDYYAEWAAQAARPKGCKGHKAKVTLAVERGNAESGRATLAKQKAADLWNPIAQQYGLTQRQYTQL